MDSGGVRAQIRRWIRRAVGMIRANEIGECRVFRDRSDAGRALVPLLREYAGRPDAIVLGLPRGGVPVAAVAAQALRLPLDVLVVRKIGAPNQPELAIGAIGAGVIVHNPRSAEHFEGQAALFEAAVARERRELERRESAFRGDRPPLDVAGKTVIVIDDGAATGATMRAAIAVLRRLQAKRIVVALPTASTAARSQLEALADRVVCVQSPCAFDAVGEWYEVFDQTTDRQVTDLLMQAGLPSQPLV